MYIVILVASFICMLIGYFYLIKKKKSFGENGWKHLSWILSCVILIIFMFDFPFFLIGSKQTLVNPIDVEVISIGKYDSVDLISIYRDTKGNSYWSGAPIGQKEWSRYGYSSENRLCEIKYLPITRIVVEVKDGNNIIYNSTKDILSMALSASIVAIMLLLSFTFDSVVGKTK